MPHHGSGHGFIHATLSAATRAGGRARIDAALIALRAGGAPEVTVVSLMDDGNAHPPDGVADNARPGTDVLVQVNAAGTPHASNNAHTVIFNVQARLLTVPDPAGGNVLAGVIAHWCCYTDH